MVDKQEIDDTLKMIADYMDGGFLDNIIDMFKHDKNYFPYIGTLLGDERMAVRIGATALVETFKDMDPGNVLKSIPGVVKLLKDPSSVIRGDAAYMLCIIGHKDALPFLEEALNDENDLVRETVEEAIEEIRGS